MWLQLSLYIQFAKITRTEPNQLEWYYISTPNAHGHGQMSKHASSSSHSPMINKVAYKRTHYWCLFAVPQQSESIKGYYYHTDTAILRTNHEKREISQFLIHLSYPVSIFMLYLVKWNHNVMIIIIYVPTN